MRAFWAGILDKISTGWQFLVGMTTPDNMYLLSQRPHPAGNILAAHRSWIRPSIAPCSLGMLSSRRWHLLASLCLWWAIPLAAPVRDHHRRARSNGIAFPSCGIGHGSEHQSIRNPVPIGRQPIAKPSPKLHPTFSPAQSLASVAVITATACSTKMPQRPPGRDRE